MRIVIWGIGGALALGVTPALAAPTTEREGEDSAIDAAVVSGEEPIGEVAEAATTAGTTCRASCAVGYAAVCLRVQQICAVSTVVTIGGAAVPCGVATAAVCLTATAVAVVCADRCPP